MASNDRGQPPPPSYEDAVGVDADAARYASLDRATVYGSLSTSKGRASGDQAQRLTISDSPHESDDEETILLKAELRRLRQGKLEQKKHLLLDEIGRERTYSGTVCRTATQGRSGAAPYQSLLHSSTPQIVPANTTIPGGITVHPTVTYSSSHGTMYSPVGPAASAIGMRVPADSPTDESVRSETGGKSKSSPIMFVIVSLVLVVTFLIIVACFL